MPKDRQNLAGIVFSASASRWIAEARGLLEPQFEADVVGLLRQNSSHQKGGDSRWCRAVHDDGDGSVQWFRLPENEADRGKDQTKEERIGERIG